MSLSLSLILHCCSHAVTSISDYSQKAETSSHQQTKTKDGNSDVVDDSGNQILAKTTAESARQLPLEDNTSFTSHVVVFPRAQNMSFSSDCNVVTSDSYWVAMDLKAEPAR